MKIQKIRPEDMLTSSQEITFAMLLGCTASILTSREGGKLNGKIIHGDPAITTVYGAPGMGKTFTAKKIGIETMTDFGKVSPLSLVLGQPVFFTSFHAQNTTSEELGLNIPTNQDHPDIKGIAKMIRAKGTNHLTRSQQEKLLADGKSPYQVIHIDEPGRNRAILSQITSAFVDCNCENFSPHPAYTMIIFTDNGTSTEGTVEFSTHLVNRCIQFAIDSKSEKYQKDIIALKKRLGDSDRSIFRWINTQTQIPIHELNYAFKSIRSDRYSVAIDNAVDYLKKVEVKAKEKTCYPFAGLPYMDKIRKAAIAGCLGNEAVIQDDMYDILSESGLKPFEEFTSVPVSSFPSDAVLPAYAYTLVGLAECNPKSPKTKVVLDWVEKEVKPNKAELYRELKRKYPETIK